MAIFTDKNIFRVVIALLVFGTLYRLYPIFAGEDAMAQFFMTEDGYLMLTIARNMAIGLGMSVSDGTIPSNGVQPLATFLFAIPYVLTGGDKVSSLVGVHLISAVIAALGIFSVRALARMVLAPLDPRPIWPWLITCLWYLGPLLVLHSMNGLETGLYTLMVTLTLVLFGNLLSKGDAASFGDRMLFGAACGVTFLARNDAVFLLVPLFLIWAGYGLIARRDSFARVAGHLIPPGVLSLVIASPWLINNYINFGSIVPVSGTAQALSGGLAKNATILPSKLFEHMFPMLPIPESMEPSTPVIVVSLAVVFAVSAIFLFGVLRRGSIARHVVATYTAFAVIMSVYYGLYFGAGWFLSRYLAPVAPLLIIAMFYAALAISTRITPKFVGGLMTGAALASLALSTALLIRYHVPGVKEQGHFQVVDWVDENIEPETWLGAVQTGTLGYWHDRTINLDGKVNPAALNALLTEGNVLNYVLESPAQYLVDWWGIVTWITDPKPEHDALRAEFEVLVDDPERNLGALKRTQ